jgi:sulfide dehydrogenase [flavocytochrome c] flavoprotein subunit
MNRREFLQYGLLGTVLSACSSTPTRFPPPNQAKVLVVGAGFGGATAAKYIRLFSNYGIEVTLIDPKPFFVSCPMSNLVIAGLKNMDDITISYSNLKKKHGIRFIQDSVESINTDKRFVKTAQGKTLAYDKLVLSPGIELMTNSISGLAAANKMGATLQAWHAGPETLALRKQLEAMPNGGVYVISVPLAPYRCPPGPYERASLVANYFKQHKKRSKVIVLDANPEITSKGKLFKSVWESQYKGILEYRPNQRVIEVDGKTKTLYFEFEKPLKAQVLNILPDMRAGKLAAKTNLANINNRWSEVHYQTFESTQANHIHIVGDAIQTAPQMPKSGHMANSQAKVAAAAIVAELNGWEVDATPLLNNTCYSYVNSESAIHVASVHTYNARQDTFLPVGGSGGVSASASELEGIYAWDWAQNIWLDSLG